MLYEPTHNYYGHPYKLFKELKDSDIIYVIDFEQIKLIPIQIYSVQVTDKSDYWSEALFNVEFETSDIQINWHREISIFDGNSYLANFYDGNKHWYFTTDKRIGDTILDMIKDRNGYQWNAFTSLFGNPMSRYADKEIIIG